MVYSLLLSSVEKGKKKQSKIYTINLYSSKKGNSYYYFKQNHITLGSDVQTLRAFHVSLLHEFRHFCQDRCLKIPFTVKNYNEATHLTYMNSPIEIDANNYTSYNIARVMQYYKRIVSLRNKFAEFRDYTGNNV